MNTDLKLDGDSFLPLRDVVYETLRNAILRGELKPGERLMEVHLASKLGVSRTPIREAIRMLEHEGLAITIPRCGAQVARMNEKDLQDVLELREALDGFAVSVAFKRRTEDELRRLKESFADFEEAVKSGDVRRVVDMDEAFHDIIYGMTHNARLESIIGNIREQMYRYRYEYIKSLDSMQTLIDEHRSIVEGFEKDDSDDVINIMHTHLENQVDGVRQQIQTQES